MKKIIILAAMCATALLGACDSNTMQGRVPAVGAPYEIILIASQPKWEGALGDTIRNILREPVEVLNKYEPLYDIARVLPNQFSGLLTKSRNVLNVVSGPDHPELSMTAQYDVYATPQMIVTLAGPDDASLTQYVSDHRTELQAIFEIAERDRSTALNKRYGEEKIQQQIFDKFGFNMYLTKGYTVRNSLKDFIWISFEYPTASQGVVIYSYPYTGRENFTVDSLVANRNRFVSLIPGQNEGSHMTTYDGFEPLVKHLRINGRYWAEMRGFWDVAHDYMGGTFVSYSTLDVETRRVVTIDFYVYSPDKPKRNFLRLLEHLMYGVSFPADQAADAALAPAQE